MVTVVQILFCLSVSRAGCPVGFAHRNITGVGGSFWLLLFQLPENGIKHSVQTAVSTGRGVHKNTENRHGEVRMSWICAMCLVLHFLPKSWLLNIYSDKKALRYALRGRGEICLFKCTVFTDLFFFSLSSVSCMCGFFSLSLSLFVVKVNSLGC